MRSLCLVISLAGLAGCDPNLSQLPDGTPTADSRPPPDTRLPIDGPPADAACRDRILDLGGLDFPDGHHFGYNITPELNGERCTYGCHRAGFANGPNFHFGGTLYVNYAGQAPQVGATVHAVDAMGRQYEAISRMNGNFWIRESDGPLTFPIKVWASACPTVKEMVLLTPDPGDCNDTSGACHTHDPPFRVRLPNL
jgi:hypothetical protein